ncbi:tetratricopeptide repeat protein [Methylomagnum sp.]
MEITGILMLAIQIGFAVHAMRRGYPLFWVFLIIFVPLIGCLLYIIMVILPEALQSRTARQGSKVFLKAIDPGKELRRLREALEISDTIGNRLALAREYLRQGKLDEAIDLFESSLSGMYRTDPDILIGLATALVEAQRFDRARAALETLFQANPDYDSADARLLYARSLDALDQTDQAAGEYLGLLQRSSSTELKCRYALLLKRTGNLAEAKALFGEVLKDAKGGSQHSNRLNKEWVDMAKREAG